MRVMSRSTWLSSGWSRRVGAVGSRCLRRWVLRRLLRVLVEHVDEAIAEVDSGVPPVGDCIAHVDELEAR